MNLLDASLLGIIQGLAEFLPISSSGHLVLGQHLISGLSEPGVIFEAFLHAGTLLSILLYFRKSIFKLSRKYLLFIVVGTIPAAIVGYFFSGFFEGLFENIKVVGAALLVTGIFNLFVDRPVEKKRKLSYRTSLVVGAFQAFAIIPGISRSGSTIFAGTRSGIDKKEAAKFSFLLSVPAVLGANVLQFLKYSGNFAGNFSSYFVGFFFAFISGYLAIKIVFKVLQQRKFRIFGYYALLAGGLVLTLL